MPELAFPPDFLWGAATAAHQVEGDNRNSDWWEWERRPGTPCAEPSGAACEHYSRYPEDVALLASLGLNAYRFSVEWARVEPAEGTFDPDQLAHYRRMVDCVRSHGLVPVVTLNHFTLPRWVAAQGGWTSPRTPALFERYCRRTLEALGDGSTWYCTINEPAAVATGGHIGGWGFPPGIVDAELWRRATRHLVEAHRRAVGAIRDVRPGAKAGATLNMNEISSTPGGKPAADYNRRVNEDVFLDALADDDFVGVQTYTRFQYLLPRVAAPLTRLALALRPLENAVVPRVLRLHARSGGTDAPAGARTTDMGWEFRPQAVAATVRRVAHRHPGKDILVTEHGIATRDDRERVEFVTEGLAALHAAIEDGIPLRGYVHWSLLDNFEWTLGYRMRFGLVGVDRTTQERTIHPSARLLGEIARSGRLRVA